MKKSLLCYSRVLELSFGGGVIWQKIGINSFKIRVLTHKQTKQVYRIYRLLLNIQKSTDTLTHLIVIMSQ